MLDETTLAAPELGADGTDQGFIKWFKALPQVFNDGVKAHC